MATLLSSAQALIIDSYTAASNDRFANDPGFIANAFNLSGVSRASNGAWVTMISPNVYIGCYHYTPATGNTVTFYQTNNPAGPSVTRTISATRQRIGTTDIFLGTLDAALPEGYAFYPIAAPAISSSQDWTNTHRNKSLYHIGNSPAAARTPALSISVGRNLADQWFGLHRIKSSSTFAFGAMCDPAGTEHHQRHETKIVTGDSGAPAFVDNGSSIPLLLGLAWGTATRKNGSTASVFTCLGNYQPEIDAFIGSHSAHSSGE